MRSLSVGIAVAINTAAGDLLSWNYPPMLLSAALKMSSETHLAEEFCE
jgi:hypothetical protein